MNEKEKLAFPKGLARGGSKSNLFALTGEGDWSDKRRSP